MYHNIFLGLKENVSLKEIKILEMKYSFTMPKLIKKHFLRYNGGCPEKNVFVSENGSRYVLLNFIPIKYDDYDLDKVLSLVRDENIMPKWLIPFAEDGAGDFFCYSLKKDELGAIYHYTHEFNYGESPESYVTYLTSSITEFIESLVEEDEN